MISEQINLCDVVIFIFFLALCYVSWHQAVFSIYILNKRTVKKKKLFRTKSRQKNVAC